MHADKSLDEYEVTLSGPGITLERVVPPHLAFEVLQLVMRDEAARSRNFHLRGSAPELDLPRFLDEVGANSNPQRIVAAALFLRRQGIAYFDRGRLRSVLEKAELEIPRNLPRDFGTAVDLGWIAKDSPGSDRFFITDLGVAAVNNRFAEIGEQDDVSTRPVVA